MADIIDLTIDSDKESYDSDACSVVGLGTSAEDSASSASEFVGNRYNDEGYECSSVLDVRSVVLTTFTLSYYLGFFVH